MNAYVLGRGYVMTNVCTPFMYHLKFFGLLLWKPYGGRILSEDMMFLFMCWSMFAFSITYTFPFILEPYEDTDKQATAGESNPGHQCWFSVCFFSSSSSFLCVNAKELRMMYIRRDPMCPAGCRWAWPSALPALPDPMTCQLNLM